MARPGPFLVFDPMGTRLIDSTPHATTTSAAPPATNELARLVACWDEPHCESTVVAATVRGSPAVSHAVRAMLNDCSPTCDTQPATTWSTCVGSMPDRSTTACCTAPSSWEGWTVDSPPPLRPMGVRTASTITTSVMAAEPTAACALSPPDERARDQQQHGRADEGHQHRLEVEVGDAL